MNFTCTQKELSQALSTLAPTVPKKPTCPILTYCRILVGSQITVAATDLDTAVEASITGNIKTQGEAIVDFMDLKRLVSSLNGLINIACEDDKLHIKTEMFDLHLPTGPIMEYPSIFTTEILKPWFDLPVTVFQAALKKVTFIPLKNNPRPFLTAITFEVGTETIKLITTDVNRLSVATIRQPSAKIHKPGTSLINNEQIKRLSKIKDPGDLEFSIGDKFVFCKSSSTCYQFRLIDAQYPRWEQVIPKDSAGEVIIDRKEFLQTLTQCAAIYKDIIITINDGLKLTFPTDANQKVALDLKANCAGRLYTSGFHIRFLIEFLSAVNLDRVKMEFVGPNKPIKITTPDDPNFIHLVMPLRQEGV